MGFNRGMNHGKGSIVGCLLAMILFVACSIPFFRLLCDGNSTQFSFQNGFSYCQNETQVVSVGIMDLLPVEEDIDPDECPTSICSATFKEFSWEIPALINFLVYGDAHSLWLNYRNIRI
jgi:hypothetical protein